MWKKILNTCPIFQPRPIFRPTAPSSNLPGLQTSSASSDQGLVRRWGRPVLRLGRSEDEAQHLHIWGSLKQRLSDVVSVLLFTLLYFDLLYPNEDNLHHWYANTFDDNAEDPLRYYIFRGICLTCPEVAP